MFQRVSGLLSLVVVVLVGVSCCAGTECVTPVMSDGIDTAA